MLRFLLAVMSLWGKRVAQHEASVLLRACAATGRDVRLRMSITVYHPAGLSFGDSVDVGEYCHIRANGGVTIGSGVLIASHVVITSRTHPRELPRYGVTADAPVVIEDDVWLGAGAIVLPGVTVGRGAIVGAGAVVTHDVAPFTIVGGVPAVVIGTVTDRATAEEQAR